MKTVQKHTLNTFKSGMGNPYQRYGTGTNINPYQRLAKNGLFDSVDWYGMPIPKVVQNLKTYGTEWVHPYIYKGCTIPKVENLKFNN